MKKSLTILFLTVLSIAVYGQKQANIWYFGNHAGLDFNNNPPTPLLNGQTYLRLPMYGWNEGCSSISDSSGSLLFYTDGENIWNKFHTVMPYGSGLMGHWSSAQSSIIVPKPNSQNYFYVFTTDAMEHNFLNGLRYTVVDICLDNGKGAVLPGQKNILLTDTVTEKLICVKHSNGIDYWIISHQNNSDAFYAFRLTGTGITDTVISHTGTFDYSTMAGGQMAASPDGLTIAYARPSGATGFTLLLDFDPATGIVSNERTLNTLNTEYAVAFSPDNSRLYFSTIGHGEIYQYNLNAGNLAAIIASKTYIIINGPDAWEGMQLAPDGKIYISRTTRSYLSAIADPNNLCPACNYIDSAVWLGTQHASFGLPNFIAGFNYSNTAAPCNTGIQQFHNSEQAIEVYPNPTINELKIQNNSSQWIHFTLYNSLGKKILDNTLRNKTCIINLSAYSSGVYLYRISNDELQIKCGKIIKE